MPTLANIQGGSLVADPTAVSRGLATGFGLGNAYRQRGIEDEQRQAQAQRQAQISRLTPEALKGGQEARVRLYQLDPQLAKTIDQTVVDRDEATQKKLIQFNNDTAAFAGSIINESPEIQRQRLMMKAQEYKDQGNNAASQEALRFAGMASQDPDGLNSELMNDIAISENAKTYMDLFGLDRDEGVSADQVQSSTQLPGGLFSKVMKSGKVVIEDASGRVLQGQERAQAIRDAEDRGVDLQAGRAGARTEATKREQRGQDIIDRGVSAAESTAGLRRGIELLDTIKTGGYNAIDMKTRSALGIEGADEGELANSLGTAVLGQLKATFGAAFTEGEKKTLENLSASMGKSPEANKRILGQALKMAERAAKRARSAAKARGDKETMSDIDDLLSFSLSTDPQQQSQPSTQDTQALDWATANPNDPRAAKILQMQGQ